MDTYVVCMRVYISLGSRYISLILYLGTSIFGDFLVSERTVVITINIRETKHNYYLTTMVSWILPT